MDELELEPLFVNLTVLSASGKGDGIFTISLEYTAGLPLDTVRQLLAAAADGLYDEGFEEVEDERHRGDDAPAL